MEGFLCYDFGGLIFGGVYTWRGSFSKFYSMLLHLFIFLQKLTVLKKSHSTKISNNNNNY